MKMEVVVIDNGVNFKYNGLMDIKLEKEKLVKLISLSSGLDIEEEEEEEERSVGFLKWVFNKKWKWFIVDEGRVVKIKFLREKRVVNRCKEKINGGEKKLK